AGRLLLITEESAGTPVVVDVPVGTDGLAITRQPVLDGTREFAAVRADDVRVPQSSVLPFDGDPRLKLQRLRDRAAVAVACDSLGVADAMLSATVSYAGVRHQFGRPIGSFQAVKHACADMLVQIRVARQLVRAAVDAVAENDPNVTNGASMAKSYTCGAAVQIAGKAMQLHGGIGYTWESGIHAYLKRAALNRSLFGSPAAHRTQLAKRYD
ncbi:MAG: acyl-CoA dehydrogenase, partial [Mycobacteriaceae bacterium]|nr:acyl-CoA dehydrogenase [Mycobacteriaceae bacterium]